MKAIAIAGLGFGDEGKGTIVDALACRDEKVGLVVRYNGGAQAAHNVVLNDGRHHTFSQFGSATFRGARTHLSRFMAVSPGALLREALHLEHRGVSSPCQYLSIDPRALVTTLYHVLANQLREELRGKETHGTTGMGVGETVVMGRKNPELSLRAEDLYRRLDLRRKLDDIREWYLEEFSGVESLITQDMRNPAFFEHAMNSYREFESVVMLSDDGRLGKMMERAKVTVFEGAQGMLLDETFGFHPYSTWSDCSFANALKLVGAYDVEFVTLGVLRTYHTRHGQGPLPTEKGSFEEVTKTDHNAQGGGYQGKFRAGPFDLVLAKYGRNVGHLDGIAMTHLDKLPRVVTSYAASYFNKDLERGLEDMVTTNPEEIAGFLECVEPSYVHIGSNEFPEHIAERLGVPLFMTSSGPTSADKVFK